MSIKGILSKTALILALGIPAISPAKDFEDKIYAEPYTTLGTSTDSERPLHARAGVTVSGRITENSSIGIDSFRLFEGRRKEDGGSIKYTRRFDNGTFSLAPGVLDVRLEDPIYIINPTPAPGENNHYATIDYPVFFLEVGLTREIAKGISLKFTYQKNFGESQVMDQYPSSRFSAGIEGKIEF